MLNAIVDKYLSFSRCMYARDICAPCVRAHATIFYGHPRGNSDSVWYNWRGSPRPFELLRNMRNARSCTCSRISIPRSRCGIGNCGRLARCGPADDSASYVSYDGGKERIVSTVRFSASGSTFRILFVRPFHFYVIWVARNRVDQIAILISEYYRAEIFRYFEFRKHSRAYIATLLSLHVRGE